MPDTTRLNKFIASQLNLGRRAADDLISAGKVTVNSKVASLGARVQSSDIVNVNGKHISDQPHSFKYVLMDKPVGYVCSRRQQGNVPTIYSLLPPHYQHLKTVGRLDKDSSGLILMTNDGDLAHRLTHPSFSKVKKYELTINKPLEPIHHQMINDHGLQLPDGPSKLQLERRREGDNTAWLVTMHEGRNRQIRRTFAALGYNVTKLRRIQFGPYHIQDLGSGKIKEIML
jgi:23S rRNA pseudouridine2605 synthase